MQWRARWDVSERQGVFPQLLDRMPGQAFAVAGLPGRRYRGEGVRIQGEPNVIDILSEGFKGQLSKLRPERAVPAQPFRWLGDREANLDVVETVLGQSLLRVGNPFGESDQHTRSAAVDERYRKVGLASDR